MENLPFLSKSAEQSPLRNAPPQARAESEVPEYEDAPQRFFYPTPVRQQQGPFDALKENHIALILIGIVIGVLIMNMRPPIIVKP
jgi:hypothetical protein